MPARPLYPLLLSAPLLLLSAPARAELTAIVPDATLSALANEASGVEARRNLDRITTYHRTRASRQFRAAADFVAGQLQSYGYEDAVVLEYPADGKTLFGTQKARLAWEVEFAELWEVDAEGRRLQRHGSWSAMPLSLAQDSVSGSATAELVDIGAGLDETDYAGKDLRGKLVLTASQPGAVVERAVGVGGAAGIVSYAPNQRSAWWLEDDRLVRWGHMGSFAPTRSFGFMVSLRTARAFQDRLAAGESVRLDATVRASLDPGTYALVSATLPGTDPAVAHEEIVFTCHLDHPRPGANDNASGCVAELEAARSLRRLVDRGILPPPRRTLRFLFPPEIEGTIIYLSQRDDTAHLLSNIHLDMVGGGEVTKAVFRVSGGPMSVPSFVSDLAFEIGRFVNHQTEQYASGLPAAFPLVSPEGSKNPQLALFENLDMGSDHQVFNEGSWRIPGIYLHDWPDRYIHTNFDLPAHVDPTKLKRAAFIAAVQGWTLAQFGPEQVEPMLALLRANSLERMRTRLLTLDRVAALDQMAVLAVHREVERRKVASLATFASLSEGQLERADAHLDGLMALVGPLPVPAMERPVDDRVFSRNPGIKGPMDGFGYSYLEEHAALAGQEIPELGGELRYEALNLVDGQRHVTDILDWLKAEFGPVPEAKVVAYLELLAELDVIR